MLTSKKNKSSQNRKKQDDPYYCGLLARIPNFIKTSKPSGNNAKLSKKEAKIARKISASQQQLLQQQQQQLPAHPIPIATFHQQYQPIHAYYPYKLYSQNHRLSQSQLSLWDARSLISAHGNFKLKFSKSRIYFNVCHIFLFNF